MATAGVLKYLESTNRPYSANDIVQNMHKEFGKTAVQKALDDLVAQGNICEKVYGKQKIYCIKQSDEDSIQESELKELDSQADKINESCKHLEQQAKETETSLRELLVSPTNAEANDQLSILVTSIETLRIKLEKLSKNTVVISTEKRIQITNEHEKLLKEFKKRKRMCMDVINAIMEGYPKSKKSLMEEVGIETDEDVKMPII